MCGRYSTLTEDEIIEVREILKNISLKMARDEFHVYFYMSTEIRPTEKSPVVTSDTAELFFEQAKFGFERWDGKGVIINARSETVTEKPMFRNHVKRGRCIVPASSYFEWKRVTGQKKGIRHSIKDKHGNMLFMAGLWREGKDGREFVIITKPSTDQITEIHDRMPVILKTDQLEAWLSGAMPIEALADMEYECVASTDGAKSEHSAGNRKYKNRGGSGAFRSS